MPVKPSLPFSSSIFLLESLHKLGGKMKNRLQVSSKEEFVSSNHLWRTVGHRSRDGFVDDVQGPPWRSSVYDLQPSSAITKSPIFAGGAGASRFPSSRVSFLRNSSNPTRFGCIRAISNGSVRSEMTFYELLGVSETGTLPKIKQAYNQLAQKYHPDVSTPDRVEEFTQCFIQFQEAYETLSDPRRRALYDKDMSRGLHLAFSAQKMYRYDEKKETDKRQKEDQSRNQR